MRSVCSGQVFRNLRVELYKCPNCSAEENIFSNETKVKCHGFGKWTYKERLPSSIDWCASVPQSMGEERWKGWKDCE